MKHYCASPPYPPGDTIKIDKMESFDNLSTYTSWGGISRLCRIALSSVGLVLTLLQTPALHADEPQSPDLFNLGLEELLAVRIKGASREERTLQSTPAIVTLVTAEEIHNSGARNLIDVLNLVPGLTLASDVSGVVVWPYAECGRMKAKFFS